MSVSSLVQLLNMLHDEYKAAINYFATCILNTTLGTYNVVAPRFNVNVNGTTASHKPFRLGFFQAMLYVLVLVMYSQSDQKYYVHSTACQYHVECNIDNAHSR